MDTILSIDLVLFLHCSFNDFCCKLQIIKLVGICRVSWSSTVMFCEANTVGGLNDVFAVSCWQLGAVILLTLLTFPPSCGTGSN